MKKIIVAFFIIASLSAKSQVAIDTTTVEKYCELIAASKMFSRKVKIDVDFGEKRSFFSFKNTFVKDDVGKAKSFNSVVDALNYMGSIGWTLLNAFPETGANGTVYHFFFKKKFKKEDIDTTATDE